MKIVEIIATDWAFHSDPYALPDTFEPLAVRAVGYLVEDHPDYVSIAMQDYTHEGRARVRDILSIPRPCIKAIYEYDKPSAVPGFGKMDPVEPLDSVEKDAARFPG